MRKITHTKATPSQIAKLMPIMKDVVANSVGIERHQNRYYYDTDTVYFENLLGGFIDGEYFTPVRIGLKHSKQGRNTLYVMIDQNKIKTKLLDSIAFHDERPIPSGLVEYSVSQVIPFVNNKDLLRYLPDAMLNESQTYSEVRYTEEDMKRMENISAHLSEKAAEYAEQLPIPPHTDPEGKKLLCLNLYAWYVKADGKLYGVIKTAWRYSEKDNWYIQYYDDSYILYDMAASGAAVMSRDDLVEIVGKRNVYMGEYGLKIEMPMV